MALAAGMHEERQAQRLAGSHQQFVVGDDVGMGDRAHGRRRVSPRTPNWPRPRPASSAESRTTLSTMRKRLKSSSTKKPSTPSSSRVISPMTDRKGAVGESRRRQLRAPPAAPDRQS